MLLLRDSTCMSVRACGLLIIVVTATNLPARCIILVSYEVLYFVSYTAVQQSTTCGLFLPVLPLSSVYQLTLSTCLTVRIQILTYSSTAALHRRPYDLIYYLLTLSLLLFHYFDVFVFGAFSV